VPEIGQNFVVCFAGFALLMRRKEIPHVRIFAGFNRHKENIV